MADAALGQIPEQHVEEIEILLSTDFAGASHELLDWCRDGKIRYSVGYDLTDPVRAAILALREESWRPAAYQDGSQRPNGEVAEATHLLDLSSCPRGPG